MSQSELNRQIAQATGETVRTISRFGFSLLTTVPDDEGTRDPLTMDWDEWEQTRDMVYPLS